MEEVELGNYLGWIMDELESVCYKLLGHVILQGQKEISVKKLKKKKSSGLIRTLEAFNVHSFPESKDLKRKKKIASSFISKIPAKQCHLTFVRSMSWGQHNTKKCCITVREYLRRFRKTRKTSFFFLLNLQVHGPGVQVSSYPKSCFLFLHYRSQRKAWPTFTGAYLHQWGVRMNPVHHDWRFEPYTGCNEMNLGIEPGRAIKSLKVNVLDATNKEGLCEK